MKLFVIYLKLITPRLVLYPSVLDGRYTSNLTLALDKHRIHPDSRMVGVFGTTISRDAMNEYRYLIWCEGRVRGCIEVDDLDRITDISLLNSSISKVGGCYLVSASFRVKGFIGRMIEYYNQEG